MNYQTPRNVRRESSTLIGRFRGGKLNPVMAVAVKGNEGGMVSQSLTLELDPIAGRMVTPIYGELVSVFVPVQGIDAIKDPEAAYAGMTEVMRQKSLSGNPLFVLENEGEISKRCGVAPRSIGGVKKVNEAVRLAHNVAVNHLRQRKYVKAVQLLHSNTAITPALISQTVLERMNGVLDPDERINGSFNLAFTVPAMTLPVTGITQSSNANSAASGAAHLSAATGIWIAPSAAMDNAAVQFKRKAANPTGAALDINATFAEVTMNNQVSLVDFYNAEKMDALTRVMRSFVDANPQYGEEAVLNWAHGLSIDNGKLPFVISEQTRPFGRQIVPATDSAGVAADTMRSDMMLQLSFSVPVPKTELGGIIITFACLKPDETISAQPHPILSDVWGADNFVADELALDPVPVTIRDLDSDCLVGQESTVAMYTGLNELKRLYVHYGLNRHLDPETVENKTALWQLEIPVSVTPENILYPETLDHYPFADQAAEVCTYVVSSQVVMQTPTIFGPTPVEELAVLTTEDIFEVEE